MCKYCETKEFKALNTTLDYSGLEIAVSGGGILRVRNYNFKELFDTQDAVDINYCPMCRKKVRRLKSMEDEELDIPIKDRNKQLELGICMECGKRKAKYLCDYITGKSFDLYGKGKIEPSTCDKYLCEKCTNKLNGKDYCKEHIKQLKEELKDIKLGDD